MGKRKRLPTLAEAHPELVAMWHPTKNGDLTPDMVTCGSDTEVVWYFPYDDPHTGKHFDFEWERSVKHQIASPGCPFTAGRTLYPGFNDLATKRPDLAAQWHPTKNGDLTPDMVTCGSIKSVSWLLPYDDPETGRHFDFEWEERISGRVDGRGCPFLTGHRVYPGFNDLASKMPSVALQWHPTKNGNLTPEMVTCGSSKRVWWRASYADPVNGEPVNIEWKESVRERVQTRSSALSSKLKLGKIINNLAKVRPDLAAQWHPTKNGKLTPDKVACNSSKEVWWYFPYDDPETGKHFDFEWPEQIGFRNLYSNCPFLTGRRVWPGFNDLATKRPDLAAQWHPTKNGDLTPDAITCGVNKSFWWYMPYDDPETGKHFDFVWDSYLPNRLRDSGCPFLSGRRVWPGYNDLATKRPDLAAQWHPTKNGDLTPQMVTSGSSKEVWWYMPYDDPKSGKHFDFEWPERVDVRGTYSECPFLTGYRVWPGYNDLASQDPELASQWHPTKNGDLTPEMVTVHSGEEVWWYLPYLDPETGILFPFEWESTVNNRSKGNGCPFLSGAEVWPGYNDLATKMPELAKEWHPTKNGDLTPEMVTCGCNDDVWWYLPYDDPETGKHFDFEWPATINSRSQGAGCPYLSGAAVYPGFNDLATKRPDLAAQWHPTKNGDLTPEMVTCGSSKEVIWLLPHDDPDTGKHFNFEWPATVAERSRGNGCPYLSGHKVYIGFNDLATKIPELAKEWHPTKNGDLTPEMVTCGCKEEVWWLLPHDDPETGKHFDFEWPATVVSRAQGSGCPYLSGRAIYPGFNDFATKYPEIAAQWHPTKNGDLTPDMVMSHFQEQVWWFLPYDDPETGKHFDFEWPAAVSNRVQGTGCPFLSGRAVWLGFNDLATKHPELAKEWHPTKNGDLTPEMVTCGYGEKVYWLLPYDDPETGKHFDFEWPATVVSRAQGTGCPFLSGHAVWPGYNDLATKHPELAKEWHPTKNGDLTPQMVTSGYTEKVYWLLPHDDPETGKHFDFEWPATVVSRVRGTGCPFLSGRAVWPGYNDLATKYPEVAKEWHPTRNRRRTPARTYQYARRKVWWRCSTCGHEWRGAVYARTVDERGCSECRKRKSKFIFT